MKSHPGMQNKPIQKAKRQRRFFCAKIIAIVLPGLQWPVMQIEQYILSSPSSAVFCENNKIRRREFLTPKLVLPYSQLFRFRNFQHSSPFPCFSKREIKLAVRPRVPKLKKSCHLATKQWGFFRQILTGPVLHYNGDEHI